MSFMVGSTYYLTNPAWFKVIIKPIKLVDCKKFVDVTQANLGACAEDDIAAKVLTRIISHYPGSGHMLIDCGWLALTLDSLGKLPTGFCVFEGEPNLK
jgi:D-serine deaminase-like pyridoxal phosphate-dependent protein